MREDSAVLVNEKTLLKDVANSPEAFADVYAQYFRPVYNFVRYRVNDMSMAEDLTAAIFEKVLKGLHRFKVTSTPFPVWLFKIARNALNDYYRWEKRHPDLPMESVADRASNEFDPPEQVLEDETRVELIETIRKLSQREQEILALKFAARLTNREIARSLGLSESHVGVILYRTVQRLRMELAGGKNHA